MSEAIQPRSAGKTSEDVPMFVTWDEGDQPARARAMYAASKAVASAEPILRTSATDFFANVGGPNISVRDGVSREDYDAFRPGEGSTLLTPKEAIRRCNSAYEHVGVIRNVIDLMADFACQGIGLYHPNERIQRFYREWFRRIRGAERSERFLNLLYRMGNVVVRRITAKLPIKVEEEMRRARGAPETTVDLQPKLGFREIPWNYTFLNPIHIEILGNELAVFVGQHAFAFGLIIPAALSRKIKSPGNARERELVGMLPKVLMDAILKGGGFIPLDPDKVRGFWYKRDDWELWARPMIYPILSDINLLKKMKLADTAALDGAISCIRVWKLGNIEARILPTQAAIEKLSQMLMNNVGGGVMDLVWGPEIELTETSTAAHKFLGQGKYEPVLTQIYAGLGIPPTLTGADSKGGFTNNYISLKTLTERLEYGRQVLRDFWEEEIRLVQKAMNFRFPATLVFDRMTLSDEAAEKQLLLNLWDRALVSDEVVVDRFGEVPDIEEARVRRDERKRRDGMKPPKASPFHDPQQDYGLKKIFAQLGVITPEEAGVELDENTGGEKTLIEQQGDQQTKQSKLQNQANNDQMDHQFRTEKLQLQHGVHPTQVQMQQQGMKPKVNKTKVGSPGRPNNSKDTKPRKQRQPQPRTSAEFLRNFAWAEQAQAKVHSLASMAYLKQLNKKTLRELTDDEAATFEEYKFCVLCRLEPHVDVTEKILAAASVAPLSIPAPMSSLLTSTVNKHIENTGREPSVDVLRRYQTGVIALWHTPDDEPEGSGVVSSV